MSRCFPFPPPGYEKKIRTDEVDPLLKEKLKKEKKHKKEKRDKEKKEGKEKRDKETSRDKHKERKEKKEKHKDRKDKDRDNEKNRTPSGDKKTAGDLQNIGDREKHVTKALQNNGNGESKFVQDLARRINNGEEAAGSQSAHISCPVPQSNHRKDEEKRIGVHKNFAMAERSENAGVSSCMNHGGAKVMVKPVEEKNQAKKIEPQEKNHRRESVTKSVMPLDKDLVMKIEPTNITDRSSKEKKEEKTDVLNKTGQEKPKFVEGGPRLKGREHGSVDTRNGRVPELPKESVKNITAERVLGKRKDLETNGFIYENGSRPNKIQRPVASPISSVENGSKLGASQTPPRPTSVLQAKVCKPEVKEHRTNGFIDPQEPKRRPPDPPAKVKENGEASAKKRPHPDLKYLDQILNVPKKKELNDDDADEHRWLFGQPGVRLLNKQRTDATTNSLDETTPQIWNQALRIESADIVALPYVVPF